MYAIPLMAKGWQGLARSRKFKSWYAYFEHESHQIIQVNGDLVAGGTKIYTALLVHRKNKLKKEFVEAYLDLIDYDEAEK